MFIEEYNPTSISAATQSHALAGCRWNCIKDTDITGVAPVTPGLPGAVSFTTARGQELASVLERTKSSLVLVGEATSVSCVSSVTVAHPRRAYIRLIAELFPRRRLVGIHPTSCVDANAEIHPTVYIGANAVIGRATIGAETSIGAGSVVADGTVIGERCIIGPNCSIGQSGFGYERAEDGSPLHFLHFGRVRIGDGVEIGANTAIDRGTLGDTVVENEAKIDNLVHIAHNCHIGAGAFVIATAILCGGVRVGENAWIAPNVSIREQLTVGDGAVVGLASTVLRDVAPNSRVVGSPARPL